MKDFYFSKTFLNKDGYLGIAAILTSISFSTGERHYHTMELKISDCRNEINLDLTLEDEGNNNYENSYHKVDTLIHQLTELRNAMSAAKGVYDQRRKEFQDRIAAKKAEGEKLSLLEKYDDENNNGSGSTNS